MSLYLYLFICLFSFSSLLIHLLILRPIHFHSRTREVIEIIWTVQKIIRTDEWVDVVFFLRFFFDFLLFLALVPVVDSNIGATGAEADGVPPSLSFVSPSSLSGASTRTGWGVGMVVIGAVVDELDFFFSSPSESCTKRI